ncbi:MAG: HAD-IA family hydrolase [Planctomycetes bacterium]|nr:HAD-IA family hydrolase [Planctomycetota bacterium]
MYKIIFFDLDGTLCRTHEDITDALNWALARLGLGLKTYDEVKANVGRGAAKLIEGLYPKDNEVFRGQILNLFLYNYSLRPCVKTKPYDGVMETLSELSDYALACVTNKRFTITKDIFKTLKMSEFFKEIIGGDTFPEKKPSPQAINYVLKKYDIPATKAILVGDTAVDIETARNAGCKVCCVKYGYSKNRELDQADYLIDHFSKLLKIIHNIT